MPITIGFHDIAESDSSGQSTAAGHTTVYTVDRDHLVDCLTEIRATLQAQTVELVGDRDENEEDSVFITADDGRLSTYTILAPVLEQFGWRGHFFITTDWIGLPDFLNEQQIRELDSRGHLIGSHSCSHPRGMWTLSPSVLFREWSESRARLANVLGHEVDVAAVPAGYYSRRVAEAAAASGYRVLFTSEPTASTSVVGTCRVLGRYTVRRHTSASVVGSIAGGDRWPRWKQATAWAATKTAKRVAGKWYLPLRKVVLDGLAARTQQHGNHA